VALAGVQDESRGGIDNDGTCIAFTSRMIHVTVLLEQLLA
jgi:hypothetical protein